MTHLYFLICRCIDLCRRLILHLGAYLARTRWKASLASLPGTLQRLWGTWGRTSLYLRREQTERSRRGWGFANTLVVDLAHMCLPFRFRPKKTSPSSWPTWKLCCLALNPSSSPISCSPNWARKCTTRDSFYSSSRICTGSLLRAGWKVISVCFILAEQVCTCLDREWMVHLSVANA